MGTQLVNGGRILSDGTYEPYNKETGEYDSLGTDADGNNIGDVNADDFGPSTVGGGVTYTGDNEVVSGLVTSDSATNEVNNAQTTLNEIGSNTGATTTGGGSPDQLSSLFSQISNLRTQLADTQAAEKLAQENLTDQDLQVKLGGLENSEEGGESKETDLSRSIDAVNKGKDADTSTIVDPVQRAMTEATLNKLSLIEQSATRLNDFAKTMSDYSQADINDINATAMRAVERQIAENARTQRAMQFAGVIGGGAQFAPKAEASLINEIIEDGLDRIDIINDKKNSAIRTARKAEAEFNYQLFTDSVELAKEYNQEIEDHITQLSALVRQTEKDEKDALLFNQQQEERNSLILAGELIDATPEEIAAAAAANGIDPNLLNKAVNDAKFEQEGRTFDTASNALTLEQKRATLNKTYNDVRLANEKADETEGVDIPEDIERGLLDAGLSGDSIVEVFTNVDTFGIDGAIEIELSGGTSKEQAREIVFAYVRDRQRKGDDGFDKTKTEIRLNNLIDEYFPEIEIEGARFKGDTNFSSETFFKK